MKPKSHYSEDRTVRIRTMRGPPVLDKFNWTYVQPRSKVKTISLNKTCIIHFINARVAMWVKNLKFFFIKYDFQSLSPDWPKLYIS